MSFCSPNSAHDCEAALVSLAKACSATSTNTTCMARGSHTHSNWLRRSYPRSPNICGCPCSPAGILQGSHHHPAHLRVHCQTHNSSQFEQSTQVHPTGSTTPSSFASVTALISTRKRRGRLRHLLHWLRPLRTTVQRCSRGSRLELCRFFFFFALEETPCLEDHWSPPGALTTVPCALPVRLPVTLLIIVRPVNRVFTLWLKPFLARKPRCFRAR